MRVLTVRPSDFAWGLDRCRRCYWLAAHGMKGPKEQLPGIFRGIDRGMKAGVTVEELQRLKIEVAHFEIQGRLLSAPIPFKDLGVAIQLRGDLDKRGRMKRGGVAVIEYKTAKPKAYKVELFRRQVHAYVRCIEYPALGIGERVDCAHLVFFDPSAGSFLASTKGCAQTGALSSSPIRLERDWFINTILREVAELLASPDLPDAGSECELCAHVSTVIGYHVDRGYLKRA